MDVRTFIKHANNAKLMTAEDARQEWYMNPDEEVTILGDGWEAKIKPEGEYEVDRSEDIVFRCKGTYLYVQSNELDTCPNGRKHSIPLTVPRTKISTKEYQRFSEVLDEVYEPGESIDWRHISEYAPLTLEFIKHYRPILEEHLITQNFNMSEDVLDSIKFKNKFAKVWISRRKNLSKKFISKHIKSLDFSAICESHDNPDKIVEWFPDKIDWECIWFNPNLSEDFIRKNLDKVNWEYLARYAKLSKDFVREFRDKFKFEDLRANRRLDWNIVSHYPYYKSTVKDILDGKE
jgi:hypothetical protein